MEHAVQDLLTIHRHLEGLAYSHIRKGLLELVQMHIVDPHPKTPMNMILPLGALKEIGKLRDGLIAVENVDLTSFKHHPHGLRIGNDLGDHLIHLGTSPVVVVETLQHEMVVKHVLRELESPRYRKPPRRRGRNPAPPLRVNFRLYTLEA